MSATGNYAKPVTDESATQEAMLDAAINEAFTACIDARLDEAYARTEQMASGRNPGEPRTWKELVDPRLDTILDRLIDHNNRTVSFKPFRSLFKKECYKMLNRCEEEAQAFVRHAAVVTASMFNCVCVVDGIREWPTDRPELWGDTCYDSATHMIYLSPFYKTILDLGVDRLDELAASAANQIGELCEMLMHETLEACSPDKEVADLRLTRSLPASEAVIALREAIFQLTIKHHGGEWLSRLGINSTELQTKMENTVGYRGLVIAIDTLLTDLGVTEYDKRLTTKVSIPWAATGDHWFGLFWWGLAFFNLKRYIRMESA